MTQTPAQRREEALRQAVIFHRDRSAFDDTHRPSPANVVDTATIFDDYLRPPRSDAGGGPAVTQE